MADEGRTEKVEKKATYYVENTVRRVGTRLHRARSATRHRFKIFLGNQRILRNKMLPLTEEQYKLHEERINELMLAGKVALHTPDGTRIHALPDGQLVHRAATGKVTLAEAAEKPAEKPVEKPLPKSVKLEPEEPIPTKAAEEPKGTDDLTVLPGIGASRVRKLNAAGIFTFADLAKAAPAKVSEVLGLAEESATEAIEAAKGMV